MKYTLLIVLCFLFSLSAMAQTEPCGFDKLADKDKLAEAEIAIKNAMRTLSAKISTPASQVRIIPVVVHVIHDGGTNNISDAQIQSQIEVLNEDFRKKAGSNGDGNGADTEIEFRLAQKDPKGRCTNGIVRIKSSLTNHFSYQRSMLSALSKWDNTRYLNFYIVKNIDNGSGTLGYSSFPGGFAGDDGIVVLHNYFGNTGTSAANLGRTATHEVGHWIGLYHTFQDGCSADSCNGGDLVCDTPPVAAPNFGCPVRNSCTVDVPDLNDQVENYMDYTDDDCTNMFSYGQKARMDATLAGIRTDIWQQWNIDSTGCDSGYVSTNCEVIADFVTLTPSICIGNTVVFYNKSLNNASSFEWYFQGGTPDTSTALNPSIKYTAAGTFPVRLIATNSFGSDTILFTDYITVTPPPVGISLPFVEKFESNVFPPNNITVDNPDGGITWVRDTVALAYEGIACAKINNLINVNYGQADALILPGFDLTSIGTTPYLYFKWAYARSDASYSDELSVLVSKDCGVNWTRVFVRTGSTLVTGPTQTTPYIPDSTTVWKTANIPLTNYSTYQHVLLKLVNVTDGGNNLYIDNINVGANIADVAQVESQDIDFSIFPNPSKGKITLQFPATSNEYNVRVYSLLGQNVGIYSGTGNVLDITDLKPGFYVFEAFAHDKLLSRKKVIIENQK